MIVYDKFWELCAAQGWSTYRLRREGGVNSKVLASMRGPGCLSTRTVDHLCALLGCQPGDIMTYVPDDSPAQDAHGPGKPC